MLLSGLVQWLADNAGVSVPTSTLILGFAAWYLWRGKRMGSSVAGVAGTATRDAVLVAAVLAGLVATGVASVDVGAALDLAGTLAGLATGLLGPLTNLIGGIAP